MARSTKSNINLHRNLRFGDLAAERDELLDDNFVETADYQTLVDSADSRCLLIGRTGAGKSAILRKLELEMGGRTIRVDPRHLSLHYITDSRVAKLAARRAGLSAA